MVFMPLCQNRSRTLKQRLPSHNRFQLSEEPLRNHTWGFTDLLVSSYKHCGFFFYGTFHQTAQFWTPQWCPFGRNESKHNYGFNMNADGKQNRNNCRESQRKLFTQATDLWNKQQISANLITAASFADDGKPEAEFFCGCNNLARQCERDRGVFRERHGVLLI